jgi:hypothetical protein
MRQLLFKNWLTEMADYGFNRDKYVLPKGGTEEIEGDIPFKPVNASAIMTELARLPAIGPNKVRVRWDDVIEWGNGHGAMQLDISPLGSMKVVARRKIRDLHGEAVWICKKVFPVIEKKVQEHEVGLAHKMYDTIKEIANDMIDSPAKEYDQLEQLAWKLWMAVKRDHPSYCMFPIGLRKQNESYYKVVFEFRGHGVERMRDNGRAEQFNIDLLWNRNRGLLRCWGYNIDSTMGQHSWKVQPSEWDEWFAPSQDHEQIIENVVKIFMKY